MDTVLSAKPMVAVSVSLLAPILIVAAGKRPNLREGCTLAVASVKFAVVASMIPTVLEGKNIAWEICRVLPGVGIRFSVDAFGLMFALVASSLWIVTSIYSMGYMRTLREHSQTRYYAFFSLALSSTAGVAFSGNLLTLYLFYEMLSLSTYALVTHHQDGASRIAGRKYLAYLMGGSIAFFLPAVVLTHWAAGTLDFSPRGILDGRAPDGLLIGMFLLYLAGIGKAAVMPFHSWLPAAMVAPTPVSSLLHAVAVVKVGVFSLLRVCLYVFGTDLMARIGLDVFLLYFVSVTILVASLFALKQDNLKARLAYSTVGQLSYVLLAGGLAGTVGIAGGMLHIVMHAFGKITLFFCAGAVLVTTGIKNVSQMKGLGKRMPVTMAAFFLGSLSVIGLPPLGGFLSKWYLAVGCVQAGQIPILAVLLLSSLLNAAYFLPIAYNAYFCRAPLDDTPGIREAPFLALAPPVFTALVSLVLFLWPGVFLHMARGAARLLTGG